MEDDNKVMENDPMEEEEEEEEESSPAAALPKMEPRFELAQEAFRYGLCLRDKDEKEGQILEKKLKEEIGSKQMAPFYEWCCGKFGWAVDEKWLSEMRAANETERLELEAKLEEATKNAGDTEVLDALFDAAQFYARIGDRQKAFIANDKVRDRQKVSSGKRVDSVINKIRLSLFYLDDLVVAKEQLLEAKKLAETGGDWDRNNRLAVYEAIYELANRDVDSAAKVFLGGVATFSCPEICSYPDFVFYAVLTNLLALERPELKKKIIDGPDVLVVIRQMPHLRDLVSALYDCDYKHFFMRLLRLEEIIQKDRYLHSHVRFLVRELRVKVYSQFLDAYKSVTLEAMATKFSVSTDFLDQELAHFVGCGRLAAKIDKVQQVVHTTRPDHHSAHYQTIIKQGDLLLNQVQQLARSVAA